MYPFSHSETGWFTLLPFLTESYFWRAKFYSQLTIFLFMFINNYKFPISGALSQNVYCKYQTKLLWRQLLLLPKKLSGTTPWSMKKNSAKSWLHKFSTDVKKYAFLFWSLFFSGFIERNLAKAHYSLKVSSMSFFKKSLSIFLLEETNFPKVVVAIIFCFFKLYMTKTLPMTMNTRENIHMHTYLLSRLYMIKGLTHHFPTLAISEVGAFSQIKYNYVNRVWMGREVHKIFEIVTFLFSIKTLVYKHIQMLLRVFYWLKPQNSQKFQKHFFKKIPLFLKIFEFDENTFLFLEIVFKELFFLEIVFKKKKKWSFFHIKFQKRGNFFFQPRFPKNDPLSF